MSGWWPKGSPHEQRKPDQYADWELRAIVEFAEAKIAQEDGDTAERRRLTAWQATFKTEQADRAAYRAAFAAEQKKLAAVAAGDPGDDAL